MLRKWIRVKLSASGEVVCAKRLKNYDEIKKYINDLPQKIAKLRAKKDVGNFNNSENTLINEIKEYQDILDNLILLKATVVETFGL